MRISTLVVAVGLLLAFGLAWTSAPEKTPPPGRAYLAQPHSRLRPFSSSGLPMPILDQEEVASESEWAGSCEETPLPTATDPRPLIYLRSSTAWTTECLSIG